MKTTITVAKALDLINGYKGLVNFTDSDGKVTNNWFGLDHMKIAHNIKQLEPIERSYNESRNALIRSLIGEGTVVPAEQMNVYAVRMNEIVESMVEVDIHTIRYENLTTKDNKIQLPALVALYDYIDGKPDIE